MYLLDYITKHEIDKIRLCDLHKITLSELKNNKFTLKMLKKELLSNKHLVYKYNNKLLSILKINYVDNKYIARLLVFKYDKIHIRKMYQLYKEYFKYLDKEIKDNLYTTNNTKLAKRFNLKIWT